MSASLETSAPAPTTLAATLWPVRVDAPAIPTWLRTAALMVLGSALLWISAKVKVPFYPVPMTMQTLVVLMLGAAYGARLGAATVLLYLVEGAFGLPVFADSPERGIGLGYMMGPTGGYLIGFVAGAYIVGIMAEKGWDRSPFKLFAAMAFGHSAVFALGYLWLARIVGLDMAWTVGVAPFHYATLLKTTLGAAILPAVWAVFAKLRGQA